MLFLGFAGATLPVWGLQPRGLQSPLGPQLPSLPTTTMSGWLATTILSVWIWKSHRILARSFSTTFGGVFHLDLGTSSPYSVHYASHLVIAFHVRFACQHFTPCCVLYCLRGIYAQPAPGVLSGVLQMTSCQTIPSPLSWLKRTHYIFSNNSPCECACSKELTGLHLKNSGYRLDLSL